MGCTHDGFHTFNSEYDRSDGVLVFFWICEGCQVRLAEARREAYKPSFDPEGNDAHLSREL